MTGNVPHLVNLQLTLPEKWSTIPKARFAESAGFLLPEANGELKSKGSQIVKVGEPILKCFEPEQNSSDSNTSEGSLPGRTSLP